MACVTVVHRRRQVKLSVTFSCSFLSTGFHIPVTDRFSHFPLLNRLFLWHKPNQSVANISHTNKCIYDLIHCSWYSCFYWSYMCFRHCQWDWDACRCSSAALPCLINSSVEAHVEAHLKHEKAHNSLFYDKGFPKLWNNPNGSLNSQVHLQPVSHWEQVFGMLRLFLCVSSLPVWLTLSSCRQCPGTGCPFTVPVSDSLKRAPILTPRAPTLEECLPRPALGLSCFFWQVCLKCSWTLSKGAHITLAAFCPWKVFILTFLFSF